MSKKAYQIEFETFINNYKFGQYNGEQVGEVIMRMVQYFCGQNLLLVSMEEMANKVSAKNADMVEESTGKQISVSKAELMSKASQEYTSMSTVKADLENIEQCINALKSLQKGIMNEYSHMGGV